jgi:acyl-CoA synthetase (AMP-forming)/AMP-acid ligase II/thioesterase domain-containing protein/acyl carrier protein
MNQYNIVSMNQYHIVSMNQSLKVALATGAAFQFTMPESIQEALKISVGKYPDGMFVLIDESETAQSVSYQTMWEDALNILGNLQSLTCRPGQKIILDASNPLDFIPTLWAILLGGMTAVPLAPSKWNIRSHREFAERMQSVHLKLNQPFTISDNQQLFHANGYQPTAYSHLKQTGQHGTIITSNSALPAVMISTSGTTGTPQLVTLSGRALMHRWWPSGPENPNKNIFLNWMPFDHVMGLGLASPNCQSKINLNATCFIKNPASWLMQIRKYKVSHAGMSNFGMRLISEAAANTDWQLDSLKKIGVGTEMISADICRTFIDMLIRNGAASNTVMLGYGLSECGPIAGGETAFNPDALQRSGQPPLIDKPTNGHSIRIVDELGLVLNEAEIGEIEVTGPTMTDGYHNDDEANARLFTADQWIRTGDIGYLQDGLLCVTGRVKETIIVNSEKYSCLEMDATIQKIPGVSVAHVFNYLESGLQVSKLGLIYTLDKTAINKQLFETIIRKTFADTYGFGIHRCQEITPQEIPRTRTGKLQRHLLAEFFKNNARLSKQSSPQNKDCNTLEAALANIMSKFLGGIVPNSTQDFFALGGDSLGALMFSAALEKELDITIPPTTFAQRPTISEIIKFITNSNAHAQDRLVLVPVQQGHAEQTLFVMPSIWGNNAYASQLAAEMGADFSVWTFHLGNKHAKIQSIVEFAKASCQLIKSVQAQGPYHLAGHSFGGLLAYEAAYQLVATGAKVSTLCVIDAIAKLEQRDFGISKTPHKNLLVENHRHISKLYLPQAADIRVSYFKAKDSVHYCRSDQSAGWAYYAQQGVDVYDIAGDHQSIVKGKSRQQVAKHIADIMRGESKTTIPFTVIADETRALIDKALQACIDGNLTIEIASITKAISALKSPPSWLLMRLAHALHQGKDNKSAVQVYLYAQKTDPWPLSSHYRFRHVLKLNPDSAMMKNVLEIIKAIKIDSAATAYKVGSIFMAVHDLNTAKKYFEAGLTICPKSLELRICIVEILILQKRHADAEQQIKLAFNYEQENDVAFLKLGQYAINLRRLELAELCFKKCIAIDPENQKALSNMEQINQIKSKTTKA